MLEKACQILPSNYSFEVVKTVSRILEARKGKPKYKVSLQFPEGLLLFATLIADILQRFCTPHNPETADPATQTKYEDIECLILGDVTYGACCVDDLASKALGCDFIVHYGHSCLVPIQDLTIKNALYVFVEIQIDVQHLVETIALNFENARSASLYLMGVI